MKTDQGAFVDFSYPGDERLYGTFERAMPRAFKAAIRDRARAFRYTYTREGWKRSRWDCRIMAPAWLKELSSIKGLRLSLIEGEGVDFDHEGGPETVSESICTGYRKADGYVHCHYWLLIGPRRHIFDPTAHQEQFEREGPMWLDHYVIDGQPLPSWRRTAEAQP